MAKKNILDGVISIKRGNRIYEVVKLDKEILITKRNGETIGMDFPLKICSPQNSFWCVEKKRKFGGT